jgi:hypothetical protein
MCMHFEEGINGFCKNDSNYGEGEINEIVEECVIENFVVLHLNFMKQPAQGTKQKYR